MTTPRPLRLVIGMLAFAGISKMVMVTLDHPYFDQAERGAERSSSLFVAAASADTDLAVDDLSEKPCACEAFSADTPEEVLAAIMAERALLENQRSSLAQRAAEIELANEMLEIETARLAELKQEVESLLERASVEHRADVERLVALYTNMKPRDAAAIMNDLDLEVMVTVLGTMAERNAAPILAALNPGRARALSLILLERAKFPGDRRLDQVRLD